MKNEQLKYHSRPAWDAHVINAQHELNQSIERLAPEVKSHEETLTTMYRQEHPDLAAAQREALNQLDDQWKHHRDTLTVVGGYYVPRPITELFDQDTSEFEYTSAIHTGENYGFGVIEDAEQERLRLGIYLSIGRVALVANSYKLGGEAFAVAPFDNASFTVAVPQEKHNYTSMNYERTAALVVNAANKYQEHILDPHSVFYSKPHAEKQYKTIESIVSIPNRELPNALTHDRLLMSGDFPKLYTYDAPSQKIITISTADDKPITITGRLHGFTSLDCLGRLPRRKLRSPHDLIDPEAGIVAGIELETSSNGMTSDEHLYYVPLRLGSDITIVPSRN